jgi:hypothetical protein
MGQTRALLSSAVRTSVVASRRGGWGSMVVVVVGVRGGDVSSQLLQYSFQSCWRGGRRTVEDMC